MVFKDVSSRYGFARYNKPIFLAIFFDKLNLLPVLTKPPKFLSAKSKSFSNPLKLILAKFDSLRQLPK